MKRFLAIYVGTHEALEAWRKLDDGTRKGREAKGMESWKAWAMKNENVIEDQGAPLGKTKRVDPKGVADTTNTMTGYVVLEAESHDAAAKLFLNHPHFTDFPGASVEIMECLPMPG